MATFRTKAPSTFRSISESTSRFSQLTYRLRTQTFLPRGGRKDEQGFLTTRKALCLIPAFRRDIQELRKRYPVSYWEQGHQADRDAQACAEKWRLTEPQWILWLVQRWNPSKTKSLPPLPTLTMPPSLLKLLKRLLRTSAFQRDILALRQRYPASYWAQGHELSSAAQQLCDRWKVDGLYWVIWLVEHWDPGHDELPPFEPNNRLPHLIPVLRKWVVTVESVIDDAEKGTAGQPFRATLTLYPGVSLRDVRAAAQIALQHLEPSTKMKGARPGLTDIDRTMLREEFEKLGIPANRTRARRVRMVADRMKQHGRVMSESVIANELRAWLREKGEPVKSYYTEKRNNRS